MESYRENKKTVSCHFDSVCDLMEYTPASHQATKFKEYLNNDSGSHFLGMTNKRGADVVSHALLGDRELFSTLDNMRNKIKRNLQLGSSMQKVQRVKRKIKFNGYGDELDIHKVYQGKCDSAWRRMERIEVDKKHHLVTLFINVGGTADKNVEQSMWRAAVAVELVDQLTRAGKSVKIIVGNCSLDALVGREQVLTTSIVVKHYNERLSLERLAAMSHLGFFRTFCFAAKFAQPYKVESGLGRSTSTTGSGVPIQIQEEVNMGHTKLVHIGMVLSESGAMEQLQSCQDQMKMSA